jgi:hypothetical protein
LNSTESIKDRLDAEYAPAWKPRSDETVTGEVVALDSRLGWDDQPYPILTIRTEDGEVAIHAFHTVLRNELAAKHPAV